MTGSHFILATAGHVDHGKSALVKALTGTDPDRLPEEKRRGITIDLGFAELNLDSPDEQRFRIGIVDVPGHEDFVRNMIAGVGSIDLGLLVVATDDGWMPQTEEHLQILIYLGVPRVVVALTKSDLGKTDNAKIREKLSNTPFENAPIIPTSIINNDGIESLKHALAAEFGRVQPSRDIGKPRLFVDRAFTLRGIGTIVTGTLGGGKLARGQNVVIQPKNLSARIRSIQSHGRTLEFAVPGMRTAINLAEVEVGDAPNAVHRGDVVTIVDLGDASAVVDVLIERSPRVDPRSSAGRPIKNGSSIYLHHGTSRGAAHVRLPDGDAIKNGGHSVAQMRLESPIFAFVGDRFVLRDPSERFTIGGGIILNLPGDLHDRFERRTTLLQSRVAAPTDVDAWVRAEIIAKDFGRREMLLRQSNFSSNEVEAALRRLAENNEVILRGDLMVAATIWRELIQSATSLIDTAHRKHPERNGLDLAGLRANLQNCANEVFDVLISELCTTDFVRHGSTIARSSHRPQLPPHIRPKAERIRSVLAAKPFDPPSRKDLGHDLTALRFLIDQGEVIEIAPEVVLLRAAAEKMQASVNEFLGRQGSGTASELRQHLATSRRVIIPFLEYLDRAGITQRAGDLRQLRKSGAVALR
jgi:selenocysteine-specific elongation factor